ncbi:MAG: zinc-binding dehydrogenase [Candidatus Eisenbacteria bacterium]
METKARIVRELRTRVWPELDARRIRPVVFRALPVGQVTEAHGILERRENVGKVVLTVR